VRKQVANATGNLAPDGYTSVAVLHRAVADDNVLTRRIQTATVVIAAGFYRDAIVAGSSADTPVPSSSISVIRGRIAVLSPIPLRGPLEVAAAHDTMLSRFEVRALRWIERKTGVSIATRPIILIVASFMALAPAGWFLADGIRRRRVGVSLVLGAVALAGGLATSVAAYEVEQLRRYERDDVPGVLQSYVDIFAGRGLDFDVITDWKGFLDAWSSEVKAGRLPYTVVAWAGAPAPSAWNMFAHTFAAE